MWRIEKLCDTIEIKIAFYDTKSYDRDYFTKIAQTDQFSETKFVFDFFDDHLNASTVALAKDHDVVCAFVNDLITKEIADRLYENGIRLIALRSAGYNNVDLKAVQNKITVVRVPAYSPHAVAEHTVALLQTLNRKIHKAYLRTRDANFSLKNLVGSEIYGKNVGIIGTGKIGKVTAEIFKGYGANLLLNDSYPDKMFAQQLNAKYVNLEELFRESDYISLHVPLTTQTRHLINQQCISLMKKSVMIVNTGRGALIDTKALLDALIGGRIRGAALDVYEEEEIYFFEDWSAAPIQEDNLARLIQLPNVILTAHQAFLTDTALEQIALITLKNILDVIETGKSENEVNWENK